MADETKKSPKQPEAAAPEAPEGQQQAQRVQVDDAQFLDLRQLGGFGG